MQQHAPSSRTESQSARPKAGGSRRALLVFIVAMANVLVVAAVVQSLSSTPTASEPVVATAPPACVPPRRTSLIWSAASLDEAAAIRSSDAYKRGPAPPLCLEYRVFEGLANQAHSHWTSLVLSLLLGVTHIAPGPALTRSSFGSEYHNTLYSHTSQWQLWNETTVTAKLRRLGITVVDECPAGAAVYVLPPPAGANTLEHAVYSNISGAACAGNASLTLRTGLHWRRMGSGHTWGQILYAPAADGGSAGSGSAANATLPPPFPYPNALFRIAFDVWDPRGRPYADPYIAKLGPNYGVFHFRGEMDNIYETAYEQMEGFKAVHAALATSNFTCNSWYLATGLSADPGWKTSGASRKKVVEALDAYTQLNQMQDMVSRWLKHPDEVKDWPLERRAALDFQLAVHAKVFVGLGRSSFSMAVATYRDVLHKNPRSVLLYPPKSLADPVLMYKDFSDDFCRWTRCAWNKQIPVLGKWFGDRQ